jgi:hypothetical protein
LIEAFAIEIEAAIRRAARERVAVCIRADSLSMAQWVPIKAEL